VALAASLPGKRKVTVTNWPSWGSTMSGAARGLSPALIEVS
jgi:hypothetical protein